MDQITTFVDPLKVFVKDSVRLVKRCTKPDRKGIIYVIFFYQMTIIMGDIKTSLYCTYFTKKL